MENILKSVKKEISTGSRVLYFCVFASRCLDEAEGER